MRGSQEQLFANKYRIERELGRGGMGVVVAAHHIQLNEKVAIKFLLPEALARAETVERFMREARAAVRIKSEHVARVSDVGVLESGEPYMVMECLEGLDLSDWLQQRGVLPVEQAVEFLLQACEAIAEAHALGIVHRDLKPSNLFVVCRADGLWSVKVLDFGISKVTPSGAAAADASLTGTAAVIGSPLYMPPEQMESSSTVDARADIWALGVVLFELITGQAPFAGDTIPEICMKVAIAAPPSIRSLRPEVPQALELVIERCLEKDSECRYRDVAEFAEALIEFGPNRARNSVERISRTIRAAGPTLRPVAPQPVSGSEELSVTATIADPDSGGSASRGSSAELPRSGRRWSSVLVTTLVFAALSGLALVVIASPSSPPPSVSVLTTVAAGARAPEVSALRSSPEQIPEPIQPLVASVAPTTPEPPARSRVAPEVPAAALRKRATVRPVNVAVREPARKRNIFDDR
ncbi:MAG TPA: serine/threonine-protein kinase [Polyangiaceae bacterium]|nr:serine/threonine-protein kinase [Polyangiaceae bacterium]